MWATLLKAVLDWLTGLAREDTKAGDADTTSRDLKDRWRERIREQEKELKNEKDSNSDSD
jgi:hypothetical protein|tara:strand:- start:375 stop:554 length:180 start_codon:yes stop_codon:yes gene_type:complete